MLKRLFDVIVAAVGLITLSPLFLVLSLLVKLTSPGPVLYRATRVGRGGGAFTLLKFRSMVVNADKLGPGITGAGDSRITPIGSFLRRTKLDELPQLVNVLRGDMSIVGPRPEDPRYVALYTPHQRAVLNVRPGITSPATVAFRHEEQMLVGDQWEAYYIEHVMPAKLAVDSAYVASMNVGQDIRIIFSTLRAVVSKHESAELL